LLKDDKIDSPIIVRGRTSALLKIKVAEGATKEGELDLTLEQERSFYYGSNND
jgi:hypothetical protein